MSELLDDFEYTLTRRALLQIKAEVWDEAATRLEREARETFDMDLDANLREGAQVLRTFNPYRSAARVHANPDQPNKETP